MVHPNELSHEQKTREQLVRELAQANGRIAELVLEVAELKSGNGVEKSLARKPGQGPEQHLRNVLDNMIALIGVMTPDGVLIEANRTALEVANLRREDVLFKPFEECYWWAWSPEVQKRLRKAIDQVAAGQAIRYDAVIRVGENAFITIDFMLSPMGR